MHRRHSSTDARSEVASQALLYLSLPPIETFGCRNIEETETCLFDPSTQNYMCRRASTSGCPEHSPEVLSPLAYHWLSESLTSSMNLHRTRCIQQFVTATLLNPAFVCILYQSASHYCACTKLLHSPVAHTNAQDHQRCKHQRCTQEKCSLSACRS